jgi:hypothetical protein
MCNPLGAPPPAVKPGAKALPNGPEPEESEANSLLAAYRDLVMERANSLVRKGTTALRDIAKRHPEVHACEREVERFYS